ncbi:WhiB family transcriptional regulator [Streptomyces sp. NPDC001781]
MGSYLPSVDSAVAWAREAACQGLDLGDFFTESDRGIAHAKRICAFCPVRMDCLDEALRAEGTSRYGIYGGLTAKERGSLARQRKRVTA